MRRPVYRLEIWSVVAPGTQAPETAPLRIRGCVYGRATPVQDRDGVMRPIEDGDEIVTGAVVSARGRIVRTESGSRYVLGKPSAGYLAWLRGQGLVLNDARPVRVRRAK